ncbi:BON domain-containing protein [Cupriavidus sp. 2TAF22]|uniref:BON domain-containing protein n=1 Tax=unclassified Cupriavidus TaxID=2640874 RepID=UPI003F92091E
MTTLPNPRESRTVRPAGRLARLARTATTVAVLTVAATQLAGCFPVLAGAMAGGVTMATDRRPTGTQAIDRGLQLEAENTLNSRYNGQARISVTVYNRKVLLTGEAKNNDVKQQVEQYVRGLPNAREVIDELEIVSSPSFATQSQDTYITSKVKTMLITTEGIPSNSIKVVTEKGVVYLMGVVTPAEGDRATDVARNASGVVKVVKAFDYVSETERARLDATASSQNPPQGESSGAAPAQPAQPAPVQPAPDTTAPGATSSPVAAPVSSPVALPPGRNLP